MCAAAPGTVAQTHRRLEHEVRTIAERLNVPAVAVGIYVDGEEHYVFHGVTSVDDPLPVDEKTHFQIGSSSKIFTSTAMMRLVEEGKVDLSEKVRTYIPELKLQSEETAANVTVLNLLNHTAGWTGELLVDTGFGEDALSKLVGVLEYADQEWPLGTQFSYNNSAVNLAGHVIERVTGLSFENAMRELVFHPLGLSSCTYHLQELVTRRFTVGHVNHGDDITVSELYSLPWNYNPAGGVISTAADQIRFARFHLGDANASGEQILRRETLDLMKRPTARIGGGVLGDQVGVGWLLRDLDGVGSVGHGGSINGQESTLQLIPERDFAITILTNAARGERLHTEVLRWAYENYLGMEFEDPQPLQLSPEQLAEFAGDYRFGQMYTLRMRVSGGRLVGEQRLSEMMGEMLAAMPKGESSGAEDQLREMIEQPPVTFAVLPGDLLVVTDGESKDVEHPVIRDAGGQIIGFNYGGRLAAKLNGPQLTRASE
jgi:CubicO group peptidase (beta-lactamase class C family)